MKIAILLFLISSFAHASPVVRPDPLDFSHISGFEPEWCTAQVRALSVKRLCYGKSLFRRTTLIRSIGIEKQDGAKALYLEDQWPSVDLLKPEFGVVGPVHSATNVPAEIGRAVLAFDIEGEVKEVFLMVPSLGEVRAVR